MAQAKQTEQKRETASESGTGSGQDMTLVEPRGGAMVSGGGRGGAELDRPLSFRRIFEEFDRMFEQLQQQFLGPSPLRFDLGSGWAPRMHARDTGREVELTVELPGFDPSEVTVECTDDVLTLRGEHREGGEPGEYRDERSFIRQITLPPNVDPERAQATFRHGLLRIRIPRARENARQIPISTEGGGQPSGGAQRAA